MQPTGGVFKAGCAGIKSISECVFQQISASLPIGEPFFAPKPSTLHLELVFDAVWLCGIVICHIPFDCSTNNDVDVGPISAS